MLLVYDNLIRIGAITAFLFSALCTGKGDELEDRSARSDPKEQGAIQRLGLALGEALDVEYTHDGFCSVAISDGVGMDAAIPLLNDVRSCRSLTIAGGDLTDQGLATLNEIDGLLSLDISHTQIVGSAFSELRNLSSLRRLLLTGDQLDGGKLSGLKHLQELGEALLIIARGGDEVIDTLGCLQSLRALELRAPDLTGATFHHFGNGSRIEELRLVQCSVKEGFSELKRLPLRSLSIEGAQLDDNAAVHLAAITTLERLFVGKTKIGDEGVAALGKIESLRALDVSDTLVTPAFLDSIVSFPHLKQLAVGGVNLSDTDVAKLAQLERLELLLADEVTLSESQADMVRLALPDCHVHVRSSTSRREDQN